MAQASNNQMHLLQWLGIELPKPQTVRKVTWKVKRKWSEAIVRMIIDYIGQGNGAGPGDNAFERLVFYQMTRRLYEGRYVVRISGKSDKQYLVLQIYPKPECCVLGEAAKAGISPREVDPFWCDYVERGDPPDYEGHIHGADISDYRLVEPAEAEIVERKLARQPQKIRTDIFPLVTTKGTLAGFIEAMTVEEAFGEGDILPLPRHVADGQRLMHQQGPKGQLDAAYEFSPLTGTDVAEVYLNSPYVRQQGRKFFITTRARVVCV